MITIFLHLCLTGNTYQVNESLCKGFFFFLTVIYILLFSGRSTSVHFFKKITRLNVCSSSLLPPPWGKSFPIPAMTVLSQGSSLWLFHLTKLRFWANNSPEASGPWSQCSAKSLKAPGCTGFLYLEKEYARSRWSLWSLDRMERVGEACTWIRASSPMALHQHTLSAKQGRGKREQVDRDSLTFAKSCKQRVLSGTLWLLLVSL